jgi:signal peptidase II
MSLLRSLLCISLPLYLLDQATKLWVVANYQLHGEETTVIPDFFWIHHTANTGVAFGMGNGEWWANYLFGAVSLMAAGLIALMWKNGGFPGPYSRLAAILLWAGIAGNFTDRLIHGYVVDFLRFDLKFMMWPSFNVADACVVCAAGLLMASSFLETPKPRSE